jgi:catechol 2,3-dioxygenase-like lactoylglutathione lyase family enzyme
LLTPSEWRVAEGVRHGLSNPVIAARLGISKDAVKFHVSNALQKLAFTTRKDLRLWDGVRRDSQLNGRIVEMNEALRLGQLKQVSRTVSDIEHARRWYAETLGLAHLYSFGDLAFFDCGGVRLLLSKGDAAGGESILYFKVDDVRSAHETLRARGVAFIAAPHMVHRHGDGTEEWLAVFNDPDGRPLAIMSETGS